MLGKLAKWLRLAGYDAAYWRDGSDDELIERARAEGRLIVTRDRQLAGRRGVRALLIGAEGVDAQLAEARTALELRSGLERTIQAGARIAAVRTPMMGSHGTLNTLDQAGMSPAFSEARCAYSSTAGRTT